MFFKKNILAFTFCTLATSLFSGVASAGNIVLHPEAGVTHIDVEHDYRPSEDFSGTETSVGIGGNIGYKFSSNILILGTVNLHYGPSFLGAGDRVHVKDIGLMTGYSIHFSRWFRLTPMVGYNRWTAQSKEGAHRNSGPEFDETYRGEGFLAKMNMEIPLKKRFSLNASTTYAEYDYGRLVSLRFGAIFYL